MSLATSATQPIAEIMRLEESFPAKQRWSQESWQAELSASDRKVLFATQADQLVGVASFSVNLDTAECLRIVVSPNQRQLGFGVGLMRSGLGWARQSGAERMLLEVAESNAAGRGLYARLGFTEIARRNHYYGTDDHALILECRLGEGGDQ